MITVIRSRNADSRTADEGFNRESLYTDTKSHIQDVANGLEYLALLLKMRGLTHDHTKLDKFDRFYQALQSGSIKSTMWYQNHITSERHHLLAHVPDDVNLLDVLEHITDCVMAGSARSGQVYDVELPSEVLQLAVANTVQLLKRNIQVQDSEPTHGKDGTR